jgi:hypothetical protein
VMDRAAWNVHDSVSSAREDANLGGATAATGREPGAVAKLQPLPDADFQRDTQPLAPGAKRCDGLGGGIGRSKSRTPRTLGQVRAWRGAASSRPWCSSPWPRP